SELRKMKMSAVSNIEEKNLIDVQGRVNALHQETNLKKNKVLRKAKKQQELHPNDDVMVNSYGQRGVLLRKAGNHAWQVQLGILMILSDASDLEIINSNDSQPKRSRTVSKSSSTSHVSQTFDIRFERYENVLVNVNNNIDAAVLAG